MNKPWQPHALHILDAIEHIRHVQARGDLTADQVLYDAALSNLQTLSEATQQLPDAMKVEHAGPLARDQRFSQHPGSQLTGRD